MKTDIICDMCHEGRLTRTVELQSFPYGLKPNQVILKSYVPVYTCHNCGFAFTEASAEDIRQKTIDEYIRKKEK